MPRLPLNPWWGSATLSRAHFEYMHLTPVNWPCQHYPPYMMRLFSRKGVKRQSKKRGDLSEAGTLRARTLLSDSGFQDWI